MSYIDALFERDKDRIHVVERNNGVREYREFPANYVFYYPDSKGKQRSIYGEPVSRFSTRKRSEFEKERRIHSGKKLFESDINVVFRCLSENYLGVEPPKLHTCFFDIEVDFDPELGFSPTDDPFNPVTAISMYLDWQELLVTLCIAPKHMSDETAWEITRKYENCLLFKTEKEMFDVFFQLIEDADVMTGWNSEGYDIPYMVNRVTRVMSKDDTRKFCLMGQLPKPREYERYGKKETTYDLFIHVRLGDILNFNGQLNLEYYEEWKDNDKIIEDIKKASCILGESNEDCEKHFVLITKNFHDSYADLFKLIENKDYEFKVTIIAIGKENDLLQILSEENNANFIKIQNLNDLTNKIGDIG